MEEVEVAIDLANSLPILPLFSTTSCSIFSILHSSFSITTNLGIITSSLRTRAEERLSFNLSGARNGSNLTVVY